MKNGGLREKEDTAIGCSFVAIVLLGIALIALFHMFSFTELFSNISSIYALLFLVFIFLLILITQHTNSENRVGNIEMRLKDKIEEYNKNIEKNNYEHEHLLYSLQNEYSRKEVSLQNEYSQREEKLHKLLEAKSPLKYLASAYADAVAQVFTNSVNYLNKKSHPAHSAAEEVRNMRKEAKQYAADAKMYQYQYELLLHSMPSVEDSLEDDGTMEIVKDYYEQNVDDNEDYDRVQNYVSKEEYDKLSVDDRNQLALDRYMRRHKNNWQIGRDYEMFICHWLKGKGYKVEHTGIKGFEDLGRDIIAHKDGLDYIIQCKYWSKNKVIREKYIMQLYGTTIAYKEENRQLFLPHGIFITNIELSDTAKKFAKFLNISVIKQPMGDYPVVKCNINQGNKIYHLPFDQQYDRTQICKPGEFYANTVKEAVTAGFRRAYRHRF